MSEILTEYELLKASISFYLFIYLFISVKYKVGVQGIPNDSVYLHIQYEICG